MKIFPTSLDKNIQYPQFSKCGYTSHLFYKNCLEKYSSGVTTTTVEHADVICLFVTVLGTDYSFDHVMAKNIESSKKPVVIFDFTEYGGWENVYISQYNIVGEVVENKNCVAGDYLFLHQFLESIRARILTYFKREMSVLDYSKIQTKVRPLEFITDSYPAEYTPQTENDFYKRQFLYSFIWGYSNISRPLLHAKLMAEYQNMNCNLVLTKEQATVYQMENRKHMVLLLNVDWFERMSMDVVYKIQKNAFGTIDLFGAGLKCFRNVESSYDTISFKQSPDRLVFTYPWVNGENCIFLPSKDNNNLLDIEESYKVLHTYVKDKFSDLYTIYVNSCEINMKYHPENYVPNHIIKNIQNEL